MVAGPVRGRNTTPVHNGLPNGGSPPRNFNESSSETGKELNRRKGSEEEMRRRKEELDEEPRGQKDGKEPEEVRRHNDGEHELELRSEEEGESSRNKEECGDEISRRLSGPDQRLPSTIGVDSGGDIGTHPNFFF